MKVFNLKKWPPTWLIGIVSITAFPAPAALYVLFGGKDPGVMVSLALILGPVSPAILFKLLT